MSDTLIVSPPRLPGSVAEIELAGWSLFLRRVDASTLPALLDNLNTGHPGGLIPLDSEPSHLTSTRSTTSSGVKASSRPSRGG
ncbi:hypothetical protein [Nonomuraea soli]|uniref:Uncharacterized protein n=1 Tax=Nonomuraea soli TaxID=1032476 RepID=A0A7W0CGJ8_9ACTN|nr:hypothetical protein [Nonomuraea soli]MBA2890775.1 hypothetical protein [Nonomuraea soli]